MKIGDLVRPMGYYRQPRVGIVLELDGSGGDELATVLFSDAATMPNPCTMPVVWLEVIEKSEPVDK